MRWLAWLELYSKMHGANLHMAAVYDRADLDEQTHTLLSLTYLEYIVSDQPADCECQLAMHS